MGQTNFKESNLYTILFALIMSVIVAGGLAFLKIKWGPQQKANELLFNKTQILNSVIDVENGVDVETIFDERVQGYLLDNTGKVINQDTDEALQIDLKKEKKKADDVRRFPLYEYKNEDGKLDYIIPTYGAGLWGWISSYLALGSDKNTIVGISFDHETETPGLGAKIKDDAGFYNDFVGEKIFDEEGNLISILIRKGNNDPLNNDKEDHTIDAISGATITGDGVEDMLKTDLADYEPFLKSKTE